MEGGVAWKLGVTPSKQRPFHLSATPRAINNLIYNMLLYMYIFIIYYSSASFLYNILWCLLIPCSCKYIYITLLPLFKQTFAFSLLQHISLSLSLSLDLNSLNLIFSAPVACKLKKMSLTQIPVSILCICSVHNVTVISFFLFRTACQEKSETSLNPFGNDNLLAIFP